MAKFVQIGGEAFSLDEVVGFSLYTPGEGRPPVLTIRLRGGPDKTYNGEHANQIHRRLREHFSPEEWDAPPGRPGK